MNDVEIHRGDCLTLMRYLADASVDAVVTDPPAGIGFMGKGWDHHKGGRDAWVEWLSVRLTECLRIAKPGSRLLCWAIPRTSHWTGTAIEDAGWIIEDRISHVFGTGFPKAKSKLKPATEDWWLARKASKGVPPLNIDGCRIDGHNYTQAQWNAKGSTGRGSDKIGQNSAGMRQAYADGKIPMPDGRWPPNLILSHHPDCSSECAAGCPVAELDRQSGTLRSGKAPATGFVRNGDKIRNAYGAFAGYRGEPTVLYGDSGGASRFFYCPKASRSDRGDGNTHPTVKSTDLMRYLCRLITPPGGTILDPFCGSGSTLKAAVLEGFDCIGMESDPDSYAIAKRRIGTILAGLATDAI